MKIFFLFIAILLSGCSSLGVPVSVCDATDQSICRAEYAAEQQVNTAVDFADGQVCLDINFVCPERDPDCGIYDYCAAEMGAGDADPVTRDVMLD